MKNITNNGQSAAKLRTGEGSTTIETITNIHSNNGVEYINNDGKGRNFKNNSYVYRHRRLDNNQVFYIGVGTGQNYKRAKDKYSRNIYWKRITNITNYTIEILLDNVSQEEAYELEELLVKEYGLKRNGGILCNLLEGGTGALKGIKQSEEMILKRVKNRLNYKMSEETKLKISNAHKGKKKNKEHIEKMKLINKGKILPEKWVENMSKSRWKKVCQIDNDITIKIWDSVKEASLFFNINPSSISHCCAGRKKKIAGFNWKYFEN